MGLFDLFKKKSSEPSWEEESARDDEFDDDESESLSVYDAADIWLSNGKDEDYMFGYTEEELEDALN